MCVCVVRACVCSACVRACVCVRVRARVCCNLQSMNEILTLLTLTLFIHNFYTRLFVMFCLLV